MRLETDAVDRYATGLEVPDHVVDALRLGVVPVLDVVVVVAEPDRRVGRAGGPECHLDPVVARALQVRLPAAAVLVERLVDHVPGGQLAFVVGHHPVDVVDHGRAQGAAVHALHPARLLTVPGQGVTADLHAVRGRPVVDLVTGGEVELVLVRLGRVRLHLVLGRDHGELAGGEGGVRRVVQPAGRDRGTEIPVGLGGRGTQRPGRLGQAGQHRYPAGHQHTEQTR